MSQMIKINFFVLIINNLIVQAASSKLQQRLDTSFSNIIDAKPILNSGIHSEKTDLNKLYLT